MAQMNPVVGDLEANTAAILASMRDAEAARCDVLVLPELAITGYPPEDLVHKPSFVDTNRRALDAVIAASGDCVAVVGFVDVGRDLHNAAAVCANGRLMGIVRKRILPNYGVFDEARTFAPDPADGPSALFQIAGVLMGVSICEDVWSPTGPMVAQAAAGAQVHLNLNASPYERGKQIRRERMLATRAADTGCALVYVNQVGGQDELVFDGGSVLLDDTGTVVARARSWREELLIADLRLDAPYRRRTLDPRGRPAPVTAEVVEVTAATRSSSEPFTQIRHDLLEDLDEVYEALVVGTRDYVVKNGFSDVVIGLSGGIDSALVACVAVDALGAEHVHGVSMPSRYSSEGSRTDAAELATNLGVDLRTVSIEPAFSAYLEMLRTGSDTPLPGLTEENLQSRCRGATLMAISNAEGAMVLTTGNKSEMAVGYFTLYGDSVGGFAVIKDVFKTLVYDLCRHVNLRAGREVIPTSIITKAPSAELRPDQRDEDSLPAYEVLDPILEDYVDRDRSPEDIVAAGFDPEVVARVVRLVDVNEYKRRQCPPGVRITAKAFGKDRRLPITNGYRPPTPRA